MSSQGVERGRKRVVAGKQAEEEGEKEREVIQHLPDLLFGVNDNFLVHQSWQQCFCYQGFYRASLPLSQHDHWNLWDHTTSHGILSGLKLFPTGYKNNWALTLAAFTLVEV